MSFGGRRLVLRPGRIFLIAMLGLQCRLKRTVSLSGAMGWGLNEEYLIQALRIDTRSRELDVTT